MEQSPTRSSRLDTVIIIALLVALVVRPTLYTLIVPVRFSGVIGDPVSRSYWWLFYAWILFWEWMPFGILWWALRRSQREWADIGICWGFFVRYRFAFLASIVVFTVTAIMAPRFLYHGPVPRVSQTLAILPVTGPERIFFLVAAVSGGVCEEVCYRGLPLRLFAATGIQAWFVLPVTTLAFVFIHGWPNESQFVFLSICGLLYGGIFIFLGRRRLEWLIVGHVLYDSLFIFAP